MCLAGILDQKGKLWQGISDGVKQGEDDIESAVYSKEEKDILLTEPDVEKIVRAEAATYAGFTTLFYTLEL